MPVIPPLTPAPSSAELEAHRLNTRAFIAAAPSLLVLIPRTRTKTGDGVKWVNGTARPAQIARLIEQTTLTQQGSDGAQRIVTYQLLLPHDGQVGLYDYWTDATGVRWEVTELLPYNSYEVRATVVRFAEG